MSLGVDLDSVPFQSHKMLWNERSHPTNTSYIYPDVCKCSLSTESQTQSHSHRHRVTDTESQTQSHSHRHRVTDTESQSQSHRYRVTDTITNLRIFGTFWVQNWGGWVVSYTLKGSSFLFISLSFYPVLLGQIPFHSSL